MELDIHPDILGRMSPVFNASDLIPYEVRLLDPVGMLPETEEDADDHDPDHPVPPPDDPHDSDSPDRPA